MPYRIGGQFGGDNDGVLGQYVQAPLAQRSDGEFTGGTSGFRHRHQSDAAPPPGCGRRGYRRLPGAEAIARGLGRGRLTSLVHGWTTEPEGWERPPSGQRIRYDATSDVQMQVHLHTITGGTSEIARATAPGGSQVSTRGRRKDTREGWRSATERSEPWIWCLATCCPHSYGPRNGGRAVTAIPAVTAWKWPGCPASRWPCVTRTGPMGLHCYLPGPRGSTSCAVCARALSS